MYISTVLAVAFPPFSLTEVTWICNFVQKRWFVLPYGVATAKLLDKNNHVDVNIV